MNYGTLYLVFMVVLLGCSAFFSGSETALFSLSRNVLKTMRQSDHKLERLVFKLLQTPDQLLGSLLLGNLIVNILFFATSSVMVLKVEQQVSTTAAAILALTFLILLILCGEILPKYFSYNNSKRISVVGAVPIFFNMRFLSPVITVFRIVFVKPVLKLLLGHPEQPQDISLDEFRALIEVAKKDQLISLHQNKILTELIDFGFLKVKHVMQPRVDVIACCISDSVQEAKQRMLKNRLTKLPVYSGTIDNIVGMVQLRDVLLYPELPIDKMVREVQFVPEQKSIESILDFFCKKHINTAMVVDEYGGVAGLIGMEDIAKELFGTMGIEEEVEMIAKLSPSEYRLAGYLPVHDWMKRFGLELKDVRITTLGGFVTSLLGKIPKRGDVARWKNLTFTVERVSRHRIKSVLLTMTPGGQNDE